MAYVIGYHGKDNQWSYWTTKHGFARKDLNEMSGNLITLVMGRIGHEIE